MEVDHNNQFAFNVLTTHTWLSLKCCCIAIHESTMIPFILTYTYFTLYPTVTKSQYLIQSLCCIYQRICNDFKGILTSNQFPSNLWTKTSKLHWSSCWIYQLQWHLVSYCIATYFWHTLKKGKQNDKTKLPTTKLFTPHS